MAVNWKQFFLIFGIVVLFGGLLLYLVGPSDKRQLSLVLLGIGLILAGISFLMPTQL